MEKSIGFPVGVPALLCGGGVVLFREFGHKRDEG
jgi:hypothetical protein